MMYQKIIVPIDHGNRNLKTEQHVFTSGILESDCKPVLGEFLQYNGRYYTLSEQRIPYMRDKSSDERFFILTLFGIVMEAERQRISSENTILQVELPVGLPPKHYGALHRKFRDYFMNRGRQCLIYKGREYQLEIADAAVFPQDYAAAMTIYPKISSFSKVTTVDIGGFTLDYLLLRGGRPDLSVCDSLEKGVITLYNTIISRVNSEYDILLEDADIDSIIKGEKTDYDMQVIRMVQEMTKTYVDDLLGTLRERGLDLKTGCVVFIGGGALLLREYLENSDKVGKCVFIEDICANAKGYGLLYQVQKKGR
ncbi:plasmid segregation actin-type ATPase ParM [Waltera sp.]|uniref:plasmid segregation actin-type ATPase ParM n=1 Tax=Waltera sp. TaxID=2815806 RepID=UPI003AB99B72